MMMTRSFAQNMNASAQSACAPSFCAENNSIMIILDAALLASIFVVLLSSLLLGREKVDTVPARCMASVPA